MFSDQAILPCRFTPVGIFNSICFSFFFLFHPRTRETMSQAASTSKYRSSKQQTVRWPWLALRVCLFDLISLSEPLLVTEVPVWMFVVMQTESHLHNDDDGGENISHCFSFPHRLLTLFLTVLLCSFWLPVTPYFQAYVLLWVCVCVYTVWNSTVQVHTSICFVGVFLRLLTCLNAVSELLDSQEWSQLHA